MDCGLFRLRNKFSIKDFDLKTFFIIADKGMYDLSYPDSLLLRYSIKTQHGRVAMLRKNKTAATHIRRPISGTSARPRRCMSDGERMCEDGSCIARVELCRKLFLSCFYINFFIILSFSKGAIWIVIFSFHAPLRRRVGILFC